MKTFFGFCVLVVTVLIVNLLTEFITGYLMHYKGMTDPMKFTAIGMTVLVLILYPAFKFMDKLVTSVAKKTMNKGHHMFGKILGTLVMFAVIMFVLYCIYARQWFGINVPKLLVEKWV